MARVFAGRSDPAAGECSCAFATSRAGFEALAAWLGGAAADGLGQAELERR